MSTLINISTNMLFTTTIPSNVTEVPFINPLTATKIGMAIGLLITVFIVTILPFIIVKYMKTRWNLQAGDGHSFESTNAYRTFKLWMSRINCFAGGVFLSTGFMDIFPEMLESIEHAKKLNKITSEFPLGPFLTLIGFFMILILEESVTTCRRCSSKPKIRKGNSQYSTFENEYTHSDHNESEVSIRSGRDEEAQTEVTSSHDHSEHHDHAIDDAAMKKGNWAVTVLMIAISMHSIFEGLALGLERDTAGASRLFLALCLHKYVIALTIGLQISKSTLPLKFAILCSGIFAFATPFGVFLGFWVVYLESAGDTAFSMVAGILQGMACGTFFYVVFFEILPEEFGRRHDKWVKIISLVSGFILVSLVMYFVHE